MTKKKTFYKSKVAVITTKPKKYHIFFFLLRPLYILIKFQLKKISQIPEFIHNGQYFSKKSRENPHDDTALSLLNFKNNVQG